MLRMIIIIFVITSVSIFSQEKYDSCNCEVQRILSTYKRLEKNYIEKSKERLLLSINEDPILKNNFLMGDSANYKKLQLHINPIMKFGIETKFYTGYENIWKYLVFDTINYDCAVGIFLDDTLCFEIRRGHNNCDKVTEMIKPGYENIPTNWCTGEFVFKQYYYLKDEVEKCEMPGYKFIKDTSYVFMVDGLGFAFIISDGIMNIYLDKHNRKQINYLDIRSPTELMRRYSIYYIKRLAEASSVDRKKPWWNFWD